MCVCVSSWLVRTVCVCVLLVSAGGVRVCVCVCGLGGGGVRGDAGCPLEPLLAFERMEVVVK